MVSFDLGLRFETARTGNLIFRIPAAGTVYMYMKCQDFTNDMYAKYV